MPDEDSELEGKKPNPLMDLSRSLECVVVRGSDHHSAAPGPSRLRFHPDY